MQELWQAAFEELVAEGLSPEQAEEAAYDHMMMRLWERADAERLQAKEAQ